MGEESKLLADTKLSTETNDLFIPWDGKLSSLKARTILDVRDTDGTWFVGFVVAVNDRYVRVRYGGWDSSMDDWIPIGVPGAAADDADIKRSPSTPLAATVDSPTVPDTVAITIEHKSDDPMPSPSASPHTISINRSAALHRLRPLFERSNRFGTRGRARERKNAAAFDSQPSQSSPHAPLLSPVSPALSLDDDDHREEKANTAELTIHTGEEKKKDGVGDDDDDHYQYKDDHQNKGDVILSPSLHRVRSIDGIYDRVAKERMAMLMAFNDRVGRNSAVNHHFVHSQIFDPKLFGLVFSFLEQPPCIICNTNLETAANPLLRPCECPQRLHRECLQLTDDRRPPVCPKCNRVYAHRLRPPACCEFTFALPGQLWRWMVRWKWRLLTFLYFVAACVLAAKPFPWQITFFLVCAVQAMVVALALYYYFQSDTGLAPGAPANAVPMGSQIARIHMVIGDCALMVALFARSDNYSNDDIWSLILLFGVTQLVCALATRHDPKAWGLFRMRLWYSGFVVLGLHSSILALCSYAGAQALFWFGVWLYVTYYPWRTHPSNAADFRLWIYCLAGSPMQNLEPETQNLIFGTTLFRAQFLFACFVVTGCAVDLLRGDGDRRCAWTIIGAQALMFSLFAYYMMRWRAILFMRHNAVPQLVDWDPAAPQPVIPPLAAAAAAPAVVPPAIAAAAAAAPNNGNNAPIVIGLAPAQPPGAAHVPAHAAMHGHNMPAPVAAM